MSSAGVPNFFPLPNDTDDDDVVWAMQTALVQWKRGGKADAVVWIRRAADSADSLGQAQRATELRHQAALLAERMWDESAPDDDPPSIELDVRPSQPPIEISFADIEVIEASPSAPADHSDSIIDLSAGDLVPLDDSDLIEEDDDAPRLSVHSISDVDELRDLDEEVRRVERSAYSSSRDEPDDEESFDEGEEEADEPEEDFVDGDAFRDWDDADDITGEFGSVPEAVSSLMNRPKVPEPKQPLFPVPVKDRATREQEREERERRESERVSEPPPLELDDMDDDLAEVGSAIEVDGSISDDVEEWDHPRPPAQPASAAVSLEPASAFEPAELAPGDVAAEAIAEEPPDPGEGPADSGSTLVEGYDLSELVGFEDMTPGLQTLLAGIANVEALSEEEEVGFFGAALVTAGRVKIAPAVSDLAGAYAGPGQVVFTRGSLEGGVELRVIACEPGTRVASWQKETIDRALKDVPWVADDLRALADRYHALCGCTLGVLGDGLDETLLTMATERMDVVRCLPGEVLFEAGQKLPGIHIVGAGRLELVGADGDVRGELDPGDLVFASEEMSAQPAPATVRAGADGALLLFAPRTLAHELITTIPPLLEVLTA